MVTKARGILLLLVAMVAIQHVYSNSAVIYCNNGGNVEHYRVEAKFENGSESIKITLTRPNLGYWVPTLQVTSFMDGSDWYETNSTWLTYFNRTELINVYIFNYGKALNDSTPSNPCKRIENTDDLLCHFRAFEEAGDWTPFFVKVKDTSLGSDATIELIAGAYNNTNSNFYANDANRTRNFTENVTIKVSTMESKNHSTASPMRNLEISTGNVAASTMMQHLKPVMIFFRCSTFAKLVPFINNITLSESTAINLAILGLPFDANYSCRPTIIFTELYQGGNLVPIQVESDFQVEANPNSPNWMRDFDSQVDRIPTSLRGFPENWTMNHFKILIGVVIILAIGLLVMCYVVFRTKNDSSAAWQPSATHVQGVPGVEIPNAPYQKI